MRHKVGGELLIIGFSGYWTGQNNEIVFAGELGGVKANDFVELPPEMVALDGGAKDFSTDHTAGAELGAGARMSVNHKINASPRLTFL